MTPTRWIATGAIVVLCVVWLVGAFPGDERFADQRIYRVTVERMRDGDGYYDAMDASLRDVNGPAGSIRAFRFPAIFVVWRALPSQRAIWTLFVIATAGIAILLLSVSRSPIAAVAFVAYVLRLARPHGSGGWTDQYLVVELWAVLGVGAALALWRARADAGAAAAVVAASLIRELCAGLLLGGLLAAHLTGRPRRPWVVAIAVTTVAFAAHAMATRPHLVAHGSEIALWGTGDPPRTIVDMIAWGLPLPYLVAPVLWSLAIWAATRHRGELALLGPQLLLPAAGLFVGRLYWGFTVSPVILFLAVEAVGNAAARVAGRQVVEQ